MERLRRVIRRWLGIEQMYWSHKTLAPCDYENRAWVLGKRLREAMAADKYVAR